MRGVPQRLLAATLAVLVVLALAGSVLAHGNEAHDDDEAAEPAPPAGATVGGDGEPAADPAPGGDAAPATPEQSADGVAGMPGMGETEGVTGEAETLPPPPAESTPPPPAESTPPPPVESTPPPPVEPPPPAPAVLSLVLAPAEQGALRATAVLATADGQPIRGAAVTFRRKTTFGELQLGKVRTNARGEAQVQLPVSPGQEVQVTATFAGSSGLAPAEARTGLSIPAAPAAVRRPGMLTQRPSPWYLLALIVIVGGIWATYGYVYWLLFRLGRHSVSEEAARAAAD